MNYHRFSCSIGLMLGWNYRLLIAPTNGSAILLMATRSECCNYINHECRCQWLSADQTGVVKAKTDLQPEKFVPSVEWGVKGTIYWEILPNGCSVTADLYYH